MHRSHHEARMVRAPFVWFRRVLALALAFTLAGCASISPSSPEPASSGAPQPTSDAPPAPPAAAPSSEASTEPLPMRSLPAANAASAALELAALIVDAPDFASAYAATADALARAGIRIETTEHVFVEPVAPAARSSMWPRQVLAAAVEAQNRRFVDRISAEDAGTMLAAMGWPLASDGGSAGDGWLAFLRAWLADAHGNPDDATSFAPIFAAEMMRLGDGVDLAVADAAEVHFGLLELLVLSAAFERVGSSSASTPVLAVVRPGNDIAAGRLAVEGPCDATLERYGIAPPRQPGSDAPEWMRGEAVALVLGQTGKVAGLVLSVVSHFQKIWRAAAFYFYSFVRVENTDKPSIHKPNEDEPEVFSIFTATTGLDPEAFKGWVRDNGGANGVREMNDDLRCAESLGIPRFTDVGSLAEDVENWMVDWEVLEGMPEHAELARLCGFTTGPCNKFDRESTQGMKLRRTGPSVAEVELFVRIKEEKLSDHAPGVTEKKVAVSVRAKVDSSTVPSISASDLTSPTGMIGPGLETIAGLIQSSFKPSSKATLIVTFHEAAGWTTTGTDQMGSTIGTGTKCDGLGGDWVIEGTQVLGVITSTQKIVVAIDVTTLEGTFDSHRENVEALIGSVTTAQSNGMARVVLNADGSVTMTLDAAPVTATTRSQFGSKTVTLPGPAGTHAWAPAPAEACAE